MSRCEIFIILIFLIGIVGGGVQLSPHATNTPIVPAPGDYDDGEIGGMIGKGNRSTRRKPAPMPLCPPQTPPAAWTRTRAAPMESQRITALATARRFIILTFILDVFWIQKLFKIRPLIHNPVWRRGRIPPP
jgi:hypothetical protein